MRILPGLRAAALLSVASLPALVGVSGPARAQFVVGVAISAPSPPPPLPFYEQPPLPGPDFIWTPGYWAWDPDVEDYYWVPGSWVEAPEPGLLWTPGYWGWADDVYVFHPGYWGPHVGFYGGVAYGFGYTGFGYQGGYWRGGSFFYNQSVTRITNVNITNVYTQNVVVNRTTASNVSFNGGPGGVQARPTPQQAAFAREPHLTATSAQVQHQRIAASMPAQFDHANRGRPAIAATPRANAFQGPGVVHAAGAPRPGGGQPLGFNPGGPMRPAPGAGPAHPYRPQTGYGPGAAYGPQAEDRARPVMPDDRPGAAREASPDFDGAPPRPPNPIARRPGEDARFQDAPPQAPRSFARPRPPAPHPPAPRPSAPRPPASRPPPRPRPAPYPEERR